MTMEKKILPEILRLLPSFSLRVGECKKEGRYVLLPFFFDGHWYAISYDRKIKRFTHVEYSVEGEKELRIINIKVI